MPKPFLFPLPPSSSCCCCCCCVPGLACPLALPTTTTQSNFVSAASPSVLISVWSGVSPVPGKQVGVVVSISCGCWESPHHFGRTASAVHTIGNPTAPLSRCGQQLMCAQILARGAGGRHANRVTHRSSTIMPQVSRCGQAHGEGEAQVQSSAQSDKHNHGRATGLRLLALARQPCPRDVSASRRQWPTPAIFVLHVSLVATGLAITRAVAVVPLDASHPQMPSSLNDNIGQDATTVCQTGCSSNGPCWANQLPPLG